MGLRGRSNAKHAYHKDDVAPTLDNITDDDLDEYPIIAIYKNSNLYGADIQLNSSNFKYILDNNMDYITTTFLLCCGSGSTVNNVKILVGDINKNTTIDKDFCSKNVKSLSMNANSLLVSVENYSEKIVIRKNSSTYYYSKVKIETIE